MKNSTVFEIFRGACCIAISAMCGWLAMRSYFHFQHDEMMMCIYSSFLCLMTARYGRRYFDRKRMKEQAKKAWEEYQEDMWNDMIQ